jgi:hypothetical protein
MECKNPKTMKAHTVMVHPGNWGEWQPWIEEENYYLFGGRIYYDMSSGGEDNAGMTGFEGSFKKYRQIEKVDMTRKYINSFKNSVILRN